MAENIETKGVPINQLPHVGNPKGVNIVGEKSGVTVTTSVDELASNAELLNATESLTDELNQKASRTELLNATESLTDELNQKASKEDLANVTAGLVPMGSVANLTELNTKPKRPNDSYFVLNQTDEQGNLYIYRYDAGLDTWINTKQVVYKDVAKASDIIKLENSAKLSFVYQQAWYVDNYDIYIKEGTTLSIRGQLQLGNNVFVGGIDGSYTDYDLQNLSLWHNGIIAQYAYVYAKKGAAYNNPSAILIGGYETNTYLELSKYYTPIAGIRKQENYFVLVNKINSSKTSSEYFRPIFGQLYINLINNTISGLVYVANSYIKRSVQVNIEDFTYTENSNIFIDISNKTLVSVPTTPAILPIEKQMAYLTSERYVYIGYVNTNAGYADFNVDYNIIGGISSNNIEKSDFVDLSKITGKYDYPNALKIKNATVNIALPRVISAYNDYSNIPVRVHSEDIGYYLLRKPNYSNNPFLNTKPTGGDKFYHLSGYVYEHKYLNKNNNIELLPGLLSSTGDIQDNDSYGYIVISVEDNKRYLELIPGYMGYVPTYIMFYNSDKLSASSFIGLDGAELNWVNLSQAGYPYSVLIPDNTTHVAIPVLWQYRLIKDEFSVCFADEYREIRKINFNDGAIEIAENNTFPYPIGVELIDKHVQNGVLMDVIGVNCIFQSVTSQNYIRLKRTDNGNLYYDYNFYDIKGNFLRKVDASPRNKEYTVKVPPTACYVNYVTKVVNESGFLDSIEYSGLSNNAKISTIGNAVSVNLNESDVSIGNNGIGEVLILKKGDIIPVEGFIAANGSISTAATNYICANPIEIPEGVKYIKFINSEKLAAVSYVNCYTNNDFTGFVGRTDNKDYYSLSVYSKAYVFLRLQDGTKYISFMLENKSTKISNYLFDIMGYSDISNDKLFVGSKIFALPSNNFKPYQKDNVRFSIQANCSIANVSNNTVTLQDESQLYTDYGLLMLPESYDPSGKPTQLVIGCHGAGGSTSSNDSQTEHLVLYQYLVGNGYAVMDVNGLPEQFAQEKNISKLNNIGSPIAIECYVKGYQWVMANYNMYKEVLVCGGSMGGISSSNLVTSGCIPVLAHGINCPVLDTYNQIFLKPWSDGLPKEAMGVIFGFEKDGNGEWIYDAEKLDGFNPVENNLVVIDSVEYKTYPCPLKIWHSQNDNVVAYAPSLRHVNSIRNAGGNAVLRSIITGYHAPLDVGDDLSNPSGNTNYKGTTLSIKPIVEEHFLFFNRYKL